MSKSRKQEIYEIVLKQGEVTAIEAATFLGIERSNASRYLHELAKEQKIEKRDTRPVKYRRLAITEKRFKRESQITFDNLIGREGSLKGAIQQAQAAILYPPIGLHTIIFGETGTGKTMFAECMYHFAKRSDSIGPEAPFISFNCADYAQNPQLLFGHIFGVKKGAFTGADESRVGLVEKANGGLLFLDEIHRLPPEGQEMLFTFIDKGVYRVLGSNEEKRASVLIIGATTESRDLFLTTFNRRIPMQIQLPSLEDRTLEERLDIIKQFLQQESNRLNGELMIDNRSILAFLLYHAEGNIGQLKQDLKLACAKAFLYSKKNKEHASMITIEEKDLTLTVQKGLLRLKQMKDKIYPLTDKQQLSLTFIPGESEVIWEKDTTSDMAIYQSITNRLDEVDDGQDKLLEKFISQDIEGYFKGYINKLSHSNMYKEIIPDDIWNIVNEIYKDVEEQLAQTFDEKEKFTFALHIQSMIERIKNKQRMTHPDLDSLRRDHPTEFQLAMRISSILEREFNLLIPFDEIGFIAMFWTNDVLIANAEDDKNVQVVVLMHGNSTATSMLETVQELLGLKIGFALNLPLTSKVEDVYEELKQLLENQKIDTSDELLLLTDMGSVNNFSGLVEQELAIRTKVITLSNTMIVLESLRLASLGRSLEEIYRSVVAMFNNMVQQMLPPVKKTGKPLVIVTCFTGEGVAKRLEERLVKLLDPDYVEIRALQFLDRDKFRREIDILSSERDIKLIAGTVKVDYPGITYVPATDLFDYKKIATIQEIVGSGVGFDDIAETVASELKTIKHVPEVLQKIDHQLKKICEQHQLLLPYSVIQGIELHMIFLIDKKISQKTGPEFLESLAYIEQHHALYLTIQQEFSVLEKMMEIKFSQDDLAYVLKMIRNNQIEITLN
ncbi:sigma-54-dependent transcriptional regulator [Vagococcus sp.]|uniref:sigma-54-dependent transcriptional regulator n=1 Tax=Vagococcus sp. TaxID=1933889 RepID=UPI003F9DAD66